MTHNNHIFHIHDHKEDESFQIVSKGAFLDWLNDYADADRYTFANTYENLTNKVKEKV